MATPTDLNPYWKAPTDYTGGVTIKIYDDDQWYDGNPFPTPVPPNGGTRDDPTRVVETAGVTVVGIEDVFIVSNADAAWDEDTTPDPVTSSATVKLRAIVKVSPSLDGHNYFWGPTLSQGTATVDGTSRDVYPWDTEWPAISISWNSLSPRMDHSEGDLPYNDPYHEADDDIPYPWYTNAWTETEYGHTAGAWLGYNGNNGQHIAESGYCDIIEYYQNSSGSGWEITVSSNIATHRHRIRECYFSDVPDIYVYSLGEENTSTRSNLEYEGTEDAYAEGVKTSIMRISRRSNHSSSVSVTLRHTDTYRGFTEVPPTVADRRRLLAIKLRDSSVSIAPIW